MTMQTCDIQSVLVEAGPVLCMQSGDDYSSPCLRNLLKWLSCLRNFPVSSSWRNLPVSNSSSSSSRAFFTSSLACMASISFSGPWRDNSRRGRSWGWGSHTRACEFSWKSAYASVNACLALDWEKLGVMVHLHTGPGIGSQVTPTAR